VRFNQSSGDAYPLNECLLVRLPGCCGTCEFLGRYENQIKAKCHLMENKKIEGEKFESYSIFKV